MYKYIEHLQFKQLQLSLKKLGLERAIHPILNDIDKLIDNNGTEYTVERLKHLKVIFLRLLAGQKVEWNYVKHSDGLPTGSFRSVFRLGLYDDRNLPHVLSVLNIYKVFISETLTTKQRDKSLSSITKVEEPSYTKVRSMRIVNPHTSLTLAARKFRKIFKGAYKNSFSFAGFNTGKPVNSRLDYDHLWFQSFKEGILMNGPWTNILYDMEVPMSLNSGYPLESYGSINTIQEKGFKARVVCSPNAAAQVAFRPLHKALSRVTKGMRTDCTFDQEKGAYWAREKLRQGHTLSSIDLSSATDKFPLSAQLAVLKGLDYDYTDEFAEMSRGNYLTSLNDEVEYVRYGTGQPMGLYGSFALFSLTHNLLLTSLGGQPDEFRIVGDDVIISNSTLKDKYLSWLDENSVPVSWHKTLLDSNYAEFAGYLISKNGLYKGLTYIKDQTDPYTFVQLSRILKTPLYHLVPKKFHNTAKLLVQVPKEFGGAGLNPDGLTMLDRISHLIESLDDRKVASVVGPNSIWSRYLFRDYNGEMLDLIKYLDDQSRLIVSRTRMKVPALLKTQPDTIIVNSYMALPSPKRRGVTLWESKSTNIRSISRSWTTYQETRNCKPVWNQED